MNFARRSHRATGSHSPLIPLHLPQQLTVGSWRLMLGCSPPGHIVPPSLSCCYNLRLIIFPQPGITSLVCTNSCSPWLPGLASLCLIPSLVPTVYLGSRKIKYLQPPIGVGWLSLCSTCWLDFHKRDLWPASQLAPGICSI